MSNHLQIAHEQCVVCNIKSYDGWVESDVCICDVVAQKIFPVALGEDVFNSVERLEKRNHIFLVTFLTVSEPRFVYPVVDSIVDPFVQVIDVFF